MNILIVTAQQIRDFDEARDYDAASSYNYLNAELKKLKRWCIDSGTLVIKSGSIDLQLVGEEAFRSWAQKRYPSADF
jgi:hypothetical protein